MIASTMKTGRRLRPPKRITRRQLEDARLFPQVFVEEGEHGGQDDTVARFGGRFAGRSLQVVAATLDHRAYASK
jgi:hypothetical protein